MSPRPNPDGRTVKLRLLKPMQTGNIVMPKNTLVAGTAKMQGERLDILVSSIEYAGNIIPVELAVFDTDGQKGCLFRPQWSRKRSTKQWRISEAGWVQAFPLHGVPGSRWLWT